MSNISPDYYSKSNMQLSAFIRQNGLDFATGNAIKYICRAGYKDSKIQDLEKRVEKLEKDLLEKTDEISKLKKTNNLKSLWRSLNNSLIKE